MSGAVDPGTPAATPGAELMDAIYRRQRHVYDLTRRYYLLGRDRLIAELAPPPGGTVLEMGCGTARNLAAAAGRYPDVRLYGVDISQEMLKSAERTLYRRGIAARVRLAEGDATAVDGRALFGVDGFDRIFFSYSLSMIPGWREALASAIDNLAPGGELHVVDFSGQSQLPRWFGRMLANWLARFHVTPRLELASELTRLAQERGGVARAEQIFRDYALIAHFRKY